jgi:transcriptional antiterminator NusG
MTQNIKRQINDDQYRRYVLSVVSWQENLVVENIKERIKKLWLENEIVDFMVPIIPEKYTNKRSWKTTIRMKKLYPGYVFVKSKMNEKIWYVLRNTPSVRLIVWAETIPIPLTDKEYKDILNKIEEAKKKVEHWTSLSEWDIVIIKAWEFEWLEWVVRQIDTNRGMALVNVEILWRTTPVYVPFDKLELKE